MDHVVGISWPRSGHHMLVRLLQLYFGPSFTYCIPNAKKKNCCGSVPCRRQNNIHLSKSHDFHLDVPQVSGLKYLIQYRKFPTSVVSNFELFVRNGGEDTARAFRGFVNQQAGKYMAFMEKWVYSDFAQAQLRVDYDTFLQDPQSTMAAVVQYFSPKTPADMQKIEWVITTVDGVKVKNMQISKQPGAGIHKGRDVRDFRFYDPTLFKQLDQLSLSVRIVNECFEKLLNRPANPENMLSFQTMKNVKELEDFIRNTDEFKSLHSEKNTSSSPPDFVAVPALGFSEPNKGDRLTREQIELAYLLFLNRKPEITEIKNMLAGNKTIADLHRIFINSKEFKALLR